MSQYRHYGIDLLRIIAMIMICIIYVNWGVVFPCPFPESAKVITENPNLSKVVIFAKFVLQKEKRGV